MRTVVSDDRGAATVVAAAMIGALTLVLATVLVLGSVVATRHRAAVAADLAALGGASEGVRGQQAGCDLARTLAARNGGTLRSCTWYGWDLEVVVASSCGCLPAGGTATVRARAGPVVKVMRENVRAPVTDRHRTVSSSDERPRVPAERRHGWCSRDEWCDDRSPTTRSPARRCRGGRSACQ